jgi:hypothetical protein
MAAYKSRMLQHAEAAVQEEARDSASGRWLAHLDQRSLPHFNQLVIWVLLGTALFLAVWPFFPVHEGPRQGNSTLLFWLPDAALGSPTLYWLFRATLLVGIALWLLQRGLPWSCWLVVVGFTGMWSLQVENTHNTNHIFHMTNMLLVIQSIWITADEAKIKVAIAGGKYWTTPLVPRWVSLAAIAYIGVFHTAAGLSKLWFSGTDWANGTSLQIWTYLWGYRWSPATQLILSSRSLTQVLQVLTLVVETAGILAIIPRLRVWIGLALLGFYIGVLATFDYGFQFNALLTAIYLLPLESWITRRATSRNATLAN